MPDYYSRQLDQINYKLDWVIKALQLVIKKETALMATLDDVLADVADESTKLDSLQTFVDGLKQMLAEALAGVKLSPAQQAKVDSIFDTVEANKAKVLHAMEANTGSDTTSGGDTVVGGTVPTP